MKGQWTWNFLRKWWPVMSADSCVRLLMAHRERARHRMERSRTVKLEMRRPVRTEITIRIEGSDQTCLEETFVRRVYENACRRQPCRTFIDLGANIGVASLYVAAFYPKCSILAVEPAPANIPLLRSNLQGLIGAGRCKVLEAAVWHQSDCMLQLSDADAEYSTFQCEESGVGYGASKETIAGMDMQTIVDGSGFDMVDLLKVDIEGAEAHLFRGNLEWLGRVRAIAIEFHGDARAESGFDEVMKREGFRTCSEHWHTVLAWQE